MSAYGRRDKVVVWLANRVLWFGSRRMRNVLKGLIWEGMAAAHARETAQPVHRAEQGEDA